MLGAYLEFHTRKLHTCLQVLDQAINNCEQTHESTLAYRLKLLNYKQLAFVTSGVDVLKLFRPLITNFLTKLKCLLNSLISLPGKTLQLIIKIRKLQTKKFCNIGPCGRYYKTFYGRKLRIFVISQSVCPSQAFPAQSNMCGVGSGRSGRQGKTLQLILKIRKLQV